MGDYKKLKNGQIMFVTSYGFVISCGEQWESFPKPNFKLGFNGEMELQPKTEWKWKTSHQPDILSLADGEEQPNPDDGKPNPGYIYSIYKKNEEYKKEGIIKLVENNEVVIKQIPKNGKICLMCGKPVKSSKKAKKPKKLCKECQPAVKQLQDAFHHKGISAVKSSVGIVTPWVWNFSEEFKTQTKTGKIPVEIDGLYHPKSNLNVASMTKDAVVKFVSKELGTNPDEYKKLSKVKVYQKLMKKETGKNKKPKIAPADPYKMPPCECGSKSFEIYKPYKGGKIGSKVLCCKKCGLVVDMVPIGPTTPEINDGYLGE